MTRFWDGRTEGQSDCTPRPAFAFGDAGKETQNCLLLVLRDEHVCAHTGKRENKKEKYHAAHGHLY